MWKQFFEAMSNVFTLMQRVERQEKEIKELRQEMKEVVSVVQRLAYEQHRANEREADTRRLLLLEVENQILKAKLQLSPASEKKGTEEP